MEILWLMQHPLYGQCDAGAIWNRTINAFNTDAEQLNLKRCTHDPGLYSKVVNESDDRCTLPLYVDDLRYYYDDGAADVAAADMKKLSERFGIEFGCIFGSSEP